MGLCHRRLAGLKLMGDSPMGERTVGDCLGKKVDKQAGPWGRA